MTEINVNLRLKSATQALIALNLPNRGGIITIGRQPFGSKIKLTKTDRVLEISIPPKGFSLGSILMAVSCIIFVTWLLIVTTSGGIFTSGVWTILLYSECLGLLITWFTIFELVGTQR